MPKPSLPDHKPSIHDAILVALLLLAVVLI